MIGMIAAIVVIAIAIVVGLNSGYFDQSGNSTTIDEVCTIVSFTHSYPYNPSNLSTYTYANTTLASALETYTQTNIRILNSSQAISTVTGTTLTASRYPGISWNETICTFYKSIP
jgi:hypothetical protein